MFKKVLVLILATCILINLAICNNQPLFSQFNNKFEVYLSNSSNGQIVYADARTYALISGIYGESVAINKEEFCLQDFLSNMQAKIIFTEPIDEGISYYAYSPKIKYRTKIKNKIINLQIFVGKGVKVGSPIIFGSF